MGSPALQGRSLNSSRGRTSDGSQSGQSASAPPEPPSEITEIGGDPQLGHGIDRIRAICWASAWIVFNGKTAWSEDVKVDRECPRYSAVSCSARALLHYPQGASQGTRTGIPQKLLYGPVVPGPLLGPIGTHWTWAGRANTGGHLIPWD